MLSRRLLIAASLAGALLLPLTAVEAQTAPKKPAVTVGDTSVPGVCMLSREVILGNSKVGKAVSARLKQLAAPELKKLQAEKGPLDKDIAAFRQKAAGMTASTRVTEQRSLQQRAAALQQKQSDLNTRLGATRNAALKKIGDAVNPIIAAVYNQNRCGILLNRDAVLAGNGSNDLTGAIIDELNKKMTTLAFNLAPLPKPSANGK